MAPLRTRWARSTAGFKQMAEMINWSRLSNGVKSTALMRRAAARCADRDAAIVGYSAGDLPTWRSRSRQLLKILLPSEQALSMCFFTAQALDEAEESGGARTNEAAAVLRLATPVLKMRATRDARNVTADAMEMRGGCGYVEEFANPRLVRDAHLGSIWEGTSNIVGIDAIRRAIGRNACHGAYRAGCVRGSICPSAATPFVAGVRGKALDGGARLRDGAPIPTDELDVRQAIERAVPRIERGVARRRTVPRSTDTRRCAARVVGAAGARSSAVSRVDR